MGSSHVLAVGTEEVFKRTSQDSAFTGWLSSYNNFGFELEKKTISFDVDGNNSLNSALFFIWEYGGEQSRINSELGLRGEHYFIWRDDYSLHAVPVVNPRASLTWSAFEDRGGIDEMNLSIGSGIFSYFPLVTELLEGRSGPESWSLSPDQALINVLGAEILWDEGWKISAETYYKYYLNRLVLTNEDDDEGISQLYYNTEGRGHVAGFDIMLQKKPGRKWDGYLSYSFVFARFYNPSNTGSEEEVENSFANNEEPLEQWFYPYYHRFHNLSLVLNWHFQPGWTFSMIGSLASGAPRTRVGDISLYPATYEDSYIEQYARTSSYSDTLRNGISAPLDLRISYGYYRPGSKVYWEWYIGVEDVLVNLYQPSTNTAFNSNTGEEDTDTSADFSLGIPIPSFGIKVSY